MGTRPCPTKDLRFRLLSSEVRLLRAVAEYVPLPTWCSPELFVSLSAATSNGWARYSAGAARNRGSRQLVMRERRFRTPKPNRLPATRLHFSRNVSEPWTLPFGRPQGPTGRRQRQVMGGASRLSAGSRASTRQRRAWSDVTWLGWTTRLDGARLSPLRGDYCAFRPGHGHGLGPDPSNLRRPSHPTSEAPRVFPASGSQNRRCALTSPRR